MTGDPVAILTTSGTDHIEADRIVINALLPEKAACALKRRLKLLIGNLLTGSRAAHFQRPVDVVADDLLGAGSGYGDSVTCSADASDGNAARNDEAQAEHEHRQHQWRCPAQQRPGGIFWLGRRGQEGKMRLTWRLEVN